MFKLMRILGVAALAFFAVESSQAQPKLSKEIDRLVQVQLDKAKVPASPRAEDAEFLRRVSLDITGRIPTHDQTVSFLSSTDPEKRAKLIDELLNRPEYGTHFATIWRHRIVDRTA